MMRKIRQYFEVRRAQIEAIRENKERWYEIQLGTCEKEIAGIERGDVRSCPVITDGLLMLVMNVDRTHKRVTPDFYKRAIKALETNAQECEKGPTRDFLFRQIGQLEKTAQHYFGAVEYSKISEIAA